MTEVLHRERPVGRRGWVILLVCVVVGWIGLVAAVGLSVLSLLVMGGMAAGLGLIAANAMYSQNRYGTVSVTRDVLRVGRERIAVADIDPGSVVANDPEVPSPLSRLRDSAGAIKDSKGELLNGQGRLAGGAWAIPLGSDFVALRVKGAPVVVSTNRRAELLEALRAATLG